MDRPGRGRTTTRRRRARGTSRPEYGGGVTITIGPGLGRHARLARGLRRGARPRRAAAVARAGGAGGRRRPRRVPRWARPRATTCDYVHESVFGWDDGEPRRAARRGGPADRGPGGGAGPGGHPRAHRRRPARARCTRATSPTSIAAGRAGARRAARPRRPGGVRARGPAAAHHPGRRVDAWPPRPPVGRRRGRRLDAAAARRPAARGVDPDDVEHLVRVQRAVLGHRREVLEVADDLDAASRAWLDRVDARPPRGARVGVDGPRLGHRRATARRARSRCRRATAPA